MLYIGSIVFLIFVIIWVDVSVSIIKLCLENIYIKLIHTKSYIDKHKYKKYV